MVKYGPSQKYKLDFFGEARKAWYQLEKKGACCSYKAGNDDYEFHMTASLLKLWKTARKISQCSH